MFIIPAMVSPNVNEKIVPALAKTIERNVILTYYGSIRQALLQKYGGLFTTSMREGALKEEAFILSERKDESISSMSSATSAGVKAGIDFAGKAIGDEGTGMKGSAITSSRTDSGSIDQVEYPKGLTFFNTISLEPTYLTIMLQQKTRIVSASRTEKMMLVGFKCVPYIMDGTDNILALAKDMRGRSMIERWFLKKWNSIQTKIPLTLPRRIRQGARGGQTAKVLEKGMRKYDLKKDIVYAPTSDIISNPNKLKKIMSVRSATNWSTLTIFSNMDFEEADMKQTLLSYKDLVKAGWGDLVIINEAKEAAYFCTTKMGACYNMPFAYMRNIMNLENVLDYSEVSKWSKPFSMAPIRKALTDGYIPEGVDDGVRLRI